MPPKGGAPIFVFTKDPRNTRNDAKNSIWLSGEAAGLGSFDIL
jgi:hypothetical protein